MKKDNYLKSFLILATMVIYLMMTLTNIFFLAPTSLFANCHASGENMILKASISDVASADGLVYLAKRPDRSIVQSNKSFVEMVRAAVTTYVLLFFVSPIFKLNLNSYRLKQLLSSNLLSAHLFFCTLRI